MALLGVLFGLFGSQILFRPRIVRGVLGLTDSPEMVYIMRIVGTMLTALGLVLIVFALTFWKAAS